MAEKRKLSKSILEMKFMKRTKEKVEKEEEIEETKRLYKSQMLANANGNDNFIFESSFTVCEDLIDGRLSFRGMNKDLESYLEKINAEKQRLLDAQKKDEKEVDDEEMAAQFGKMKKFKTMASAESRYDRRDNNMKLLSNKNYVKNFVPKHKHFEPTHKKRKFMQPQDD